MERETNCSAARNIVGLGDVRQRVVGKRERQGSRFRLRAIAGLDGYLSGARAPAAGIDRQSYGYGRCPDNHRGRIERAGRRRNSAGCARTRKAHGSGVTVDLRNGEIAD